MLDAWSFRMLLAALVSWLDRRQQDAVAYLVAEDRILRGHVRGQLRLTDEERRRLAVHGHRLGRRRLRAVATLVTPDTMLRRHRQLTARKWPHARRRGGRPGVLAEIRRLVLRMAEENPTWGYTPDSRRPQEYRSPRRSTIAPGLLKARRACRRSPERPTSWQTFLRVHWDADRGRRFLRDGGLDLARSW